MMTQIFELELDLHADGCTDGYDGVKPKHTDIAYLKGYAEGAQRLIEELKIAIAEICPDPIPDYSNCPF